jgi:hypothetical protein
MRLPLPPQTTRPPLPARRYPLTTLCLLTLVVLGIHWALLSDAVLSLASHAAQNAAPAQAFTTRMVAAPALPALPVPPPRKPPKPPVPTTPPPAMAEPSPAIAPDATGDAVQASAVETDTAVALDTSDPAPPPAAQMPENPLHRPSPLPRPNLRPRHPPT